MYFYPNQRLTLPGHQIMKNPLPPGIIFFLALSIFRIENPVSPSNIDGSLILCINSLKKI
jgi:hypothetical protein